MILDVVNEQQCKELPVELLNPENIVEKGEMLPGLDGQLVRISALEGQIFNCPIEMIVPNPDQPRTNFDDLEMDDLRASIVKMGQQDAIKVVPFLKDGVVRLAIIDGERRYRVVAELGDRDPIVQVKWEAKDISVFIKSVILNEARAEHNPVERARAYAKIRAHYINEEGLSIGDAMEKVAGDMGVSVPVISNHLRLLKLPPEVLEAVAKGALPTQQALNMYSVQKKLGADFDGAKLARAILDNLNNDLENSEADQKLLADSGFESRRGVKRDDVKNARRRLILEGGVAGSDQKIFTAAEAVYKMDSGANGARRKSELLMKADRPTVVRILRSRPATPPEAVRENIRNAIAKLTEVLDIVEEAVAPDALPEVSGKPSFPSHISKYGKAFNTPLRAKIAAELAKASDSEKPVVFSTNELASVLGVVTGSIGPGIRDLGPELEAIGIKIEQHVKREKLADAWVKNAAYRLAWIDNKPIESGDALPTALQPDEEMKIFYDDRGRTLTFGDRKLVKKGTGFGLVIDMIPIENPEAVIVSVNGSFTPEISDGGHKYTFAQWLAEIGKAGMKFEIEDAEADE